MKSVFIILLLNFCQLSSSQNLKNGSGISMEKCYNEELYVMTDRYFYVAGEKVWIKIFKLSGMTRTPANMSKVVYIELLDTANNPVQQLKIGIEENSGHTDFVIPDTLRTGNYFLRAYTNWMKNFSNNLFSYKLISVINPFQNLNSIERPPAESIPDSVSFYPEGGNLIKGIETLLLFRSYDKNGNPLSIKGALIYENNDTICRVTSDKNGYGWVKIKPSGSSKISLVTLGKNLPSKKFSLPEIHSEGITLSVSDENSPVLVKIRMSQNNNPANNKLFLKVISSNLPVVKKEFIIDKGDEINILSSDLPYGLSHLIILDDKETHLAGRWIYNKNEQQIKYTISQQNNASRPRDRIKIDISAKDSQGNPVESDLAISVVKAFTVNKNNFNNPAYKQIPELAALTTDSNQPDINDYLISYDFPEFIGNCDRNINKPLPVYLPELEGHLISGYIRDTRSGEPLKNEDIILSFVGKTALCQFTKTNDKGEFNFITKLEGVRDIIIQSLSDTIKEYYVELNNPFVPTYNKYNRGFMYLDSCNIREINNAIISMQIKNIYEPFMQQSSKNNGYEDTYDFYGEPDKTIQMSKYIELGSFKEVVKEVMPGVSLLTKNDESNFRLVSKYQAQPFENNPLILVDGVPVADPDKLLNISSRELEKIDVLSTRFFINDVILDGLLHFVTKKGNLGEIDFDMSVFRQEYRLLENGKEFSSQDYSTDSLKNNRIPDFRNTLYWKPDLHTDIFGNASVEFYSSDESAEYLITVQGITTDGKKGNATAPLIIKSP